MYTDIYIYIYMYIYVDGDCASGGSTRCLYGSCLLLPLFVLEWGLVKEDLEVSC